MSNEAAARRGLLFVISAPSGTGKTTLVERLVETTPNLRTSRSYTSRPLRLGEVDGVDYNFVTRERFEAMIAAHEFVEWAEIFGNLYGTSIVDTERALARGDDLVLVIDVQGARKVRAGGLPAVAIFVLPPSYEVLAQRLRGRSKDSDAQIRCRLEVARQEVSAFAEYDYVVINDEFDPCAEHLRSIVMAERARLVHVKGEAEAVVRRFSAPSLP